MSSHAHQASHTQEHGISTGKYMMGFVLAVVLTLLSFLPVILYLVGQGSAHMAFGSASWLPNLDLFGFGGWSLSAKLIYLLGLALIQMAVQIVFFLHLNEGPDAKWNVGTMWVAVLCVCIIIVGTWLTMQHLNYNMMGGSGRVEMVPLSEVQIPPVEAVGDSAPVQSEQAQPAI